MPMVLLKMAMTLDGKIATRDGNSRWITGPIARKRVHRLRQWADAILIGAATARADHPSLTARDAQGRTVKLPRRFVATRTIPQSEMNLLLPGEAPPELMQAEGREEWLSHLRRWGREQVTALLVEGGGGIAGAMLSAGIVDRVEFHIAPRILGGSSGRPVVGGADPERISDALSLRNVRVDRLGPDIRIVGEPETRASWQ
jgi:diaminohydroxyphosphoribosylaminopyrimidine deaminase/5-amino-6-(5-phosphoribosylamino)uracil reductase